MTKAIGVGLCLLFILNGEGQSSTAIAPGGFDSAIEGSSLNYEAAVESGNPDSLFTALNSMFSIYLENGDYAKSFNYAERLYNIAIGSAKPDWITGALISLGRLYSAIEDFPHALNYYQRAMAIGDQTNRQQAIKLLPLYIGGAYAQTRQFDSAWFYLNHFKTASDTDTAIYHTLTAECFFLQGNFKQAGETYESTLKDSFLTTDPRIILGLAKTYAVLNNLKPALTYGRKGLELALAAGASQYIRDGYKILTDVYEQLQQADSSNFYFRKYSNARDIVLNAVTRGRLAALTYEQEISRMNQENKIREINLQKQVLMKNLLIAGILFILLFAFLLSRYLVMKRRSEIRQRKIAENELHIQQLESEKSGAQMQQQKTELEIKALRAQMNPHFIFNCLNSINRFIIGNEAEKAADYLSRFARLIRIVLEKSGTSLITLEEELQALVLYMDLEALRFEIPFQYEIQTNGLDAESLLVPSLIIQPFVENAIWHGFQPGQNTQGKIIIQFHREQNQLICDITDNGIGISRSQSLHTVHPEHKKSFGIKFTTERLQLLGTVKTKAAITTQDLKDADGKILGTKVHLLIPVTEF